MGYCPAPQSLAALLQGEIMKGVREGRRAERKREHSKTGSTDINGENDEQ